VTNKAQTACNFKSYAFLGCFFSQSILQNRYRGYVIRTELCVATSAQLTIFSQSELRVYLICTQQTSKQNTLRCN